MSAAAAMLRSESLMDLLASDDDDDFGLGDSDDDDDIDAFIAKNTMGGKKKEEKEEAKPEPKPDPTPAEKPVEKPAPEPTAPKEDSKAKEEAEKKAKEEAEAKIRAEAEAKVRAEMEAKAKAEAEAKAKAEMEAKIRAEAEAKVKAEMEAEQKKKAEEEEEKKKRQEEADQAAADKKAKEEEEKKKKEEEKANAAAAKKKKEEEAAAAKKKSAARPSSAHVSRRDSVSSARGNNARPQSAGSRASAGSRLRSGSVASSRSHGASTTATVARPTNANGKSKGAAASQSSLGADADAGVVEDDGESDEAHEHGYDDDEHPDDGDGHQNDEDVELSASLSHRRRKSGLSIATDVERVGAGPESPGGGRLTPKALRQFLAEAAPAEARPKPIISHRVVTKAATDTRTPVSMTRKAKQERARSIRDGNESHPQYKTFMFPDTLVCKPDLSLSHSLTLSLCPTFSVSYTPHGPSLTLFPFDSIVACIHHADLPSSTFCNKRRRYDKHEVMVTLLPVPAGGMGRGAFKYTLHSPPPQSCSRRVATPVELVVARTFQLTANTMLDCPKSDNRPRGWVAPPTLYEDRPCNGKV
eukprot:TRINITY_DN526_c1_g2_i2.p1 TRINITY_DN526_c1_g2~~TRINITY_DN526_c1_g2_i2.p1  ORF type:complete len:584 (+),score=151.41 TRINITY_DN526_c1_g2_i2:211-1962(+)